MRLNPLVPLTLTFIACAPQPELQPDSEVQDALTGGALFFRTFDGSGNNPTHPEWGASGTALLRGTTNGYADGRSAMAGPNRPSPRQVSNVVLAQARPVPNSFGASNYLWAWGQFLDHDLDLTGLAAPAESAPIAVPQGDQYFDPLGSGSVVIGFERSLWAPDTAGVRQQVNEISAFVDGSNVYGSSEDRAAALRANDGSGRLRTSRGDLLPFNDFGACADDSQCIAGTRCQGGVCALPNATQPGMAPGSDFAAGDVRANEVATLAALHTLFMREHNRIADQFKTLFPFATGDDIYLAARLMVGAEIQAITYHEFLPVLVGAEAMPPYQGYDANVNPGIENAFSTAGYRVGHTMLSPVIERIGADGNPDPAGHLPLRQAFFNPSEVAAHGIDSMLRGLAAGRAQEIDAMVVDDVRNFLFGPPGAGGFDLASLNMQRGRDHGLPSYNQARVDYGFAAAQGFADITTNPAVQAKLAQAYASVNDIDLWVGGLAEDHAPGAAVGPLFQAIIVDQFTRLRDGDRFWYQSVLLPSMIAQVEGRTLADIIRDNTTVAGAEIPDDVFHAPLAGFEGISTDTPLAIADLQTVESVITAPSVPVGMLEVEVDIRHTFRGDLVVEVIAPDGTAAFISNREGGAKDDIVGLFDLSAAFQGVDSGGAWRLRVRDAASGDVGQVVSWTLRVLPSAGSLFDATVSPALAIPDNDPAGISSTMSVPAGIAIGRLRVGVDITHTFRGDLVVTLIAPDGTAVELFAGLSDPTDDLHLYQEVPGLTGDAGGTWTLHVADTASADVGTLDRWRLVIEP